MPAPVTNPAFGNPDPTASLFAPNAQGTGPRGTTGNGFTPGTADNNEMQPPAPDEGYNLKQFDLPVPGQSWTSSPGSMAYEQPPQFTNLSKAMDYMVNRLTSPAIQTNLLRMMDAGTPIETLITPILMHGASEGKFNMDLAMMMIEPIGVVMNGLAKRAGITPVMTVPRREKVVDQDPLKRIFKKQTEEAKKPELINSAPMEKEKPKGLLAKPGMA